VNAARVPWRLTPARRLGTADAERHIADLVRLVLLTSPGERLHHPELGAGLGATTLFESLDPQRVALVELRARSSLRLALGDRIEVVAVGVGIEGESTVVASVSYRILPEGQPSVLRVSLNG